MPELNMSMIRKAETLKRLLEIARKRGAKVDIRVVRINDIKTTRIIVTNLEGDNKKQLVRALRTNGFGYNALPDDPDAIIILRRHWEFALLTGADPGARERIQKNRDEEAKKRKGSKGK